MKTFRIDDTARVVFIQYSGGVTDSDLLIGLKEYGAVGPQYSFLVDFSNVAEFTITSEGIRRLAERSGPERRARCAVVAPSDVSSGLARMFEAYAENPGIAVFRTAMAAREWLTRWSAGA
jgi:hypothetical protein